MEPKVICSLCLQLPATGPFSEAWLQSIPWQPVYLGCFNYNFEDGCVHLCCNHSDQLSFIVKYLSVFLCWLAYMYICHFSLNVVLVCCDFMTCRPCTIFTYCTKSITYSISFLSSSCLFFCTSSFFLSTLSSFPLLLSFCTILTYSDHFNFADSWFATTPFPLSWLESFIYEWEWCPEPSASNCISNKSTASGFEPEWFVIETCCTSSFILLYFCTCSRALLQGFTGTIACAKYADSLNHVQIYIISCQGCSELNTGEICQVFGSCLTTFHSEHCTLT